MNPGSAVTITASGIPRLRVLEAWGMAHDFEPHSHEDYCFGHIKAGERLFTLEGSTHHLKEHDMFVCNPGEVHSCSTGKNTPLAYTVLCVPARYINMPGQIPDQCSRKEGNAQYRFENHIIKESGLYLQFTELCSILGSKEPVGRKEKAFALFMKKMIQTYRSFADNRTNTDCESSGGPGGVQEFVLSNCHKQLTLRELSERFGMSPWYINRCFRQQTGISLHRYQLQARIEKSCRLLRKGSSIAEAAAATGFSDQSHYHRFFKKFYGVTPGVYAALNRGG